MEVLNAATVPLSVTCKRGDTKHGQKTRTVSNISIIQCHNNANSNLPQITPSLSNHAPNLTKAIGSNVNKLPINAFSTILSTLMAPAFASALTYEEALQQASGFSNEAPIDFNLINSADQLTNFFGENPLAIIAGVVLVAVPLVLGQIMQKPKTWGAISATNAYSKLGDEPEAQLIDIRTILDIKEVGSPDIRPLKKRAFQVAYAGDDASFLQAISTKFRDPANTTLYILHKFDGNSMRVARLLSENGFKAAFAIKDGIEGTNGWQKSELPWFFPRKAFRFDLGIVKNVIDNALEEIPGLVPATLGVAAAAGIGLFVFSEVETVLQLLGSIAVVQVFVNNILFAEERTKTFQFIDTKVKPKELFDDLKEIGKAFLPRTVPKGSDKSAAISRGQNINGFTTAVTDTEEEPMPKSRVVILGTDVGGNSSSQAAPVELPATLHSISPPKSLSQYP